MTASISSSAAVACIGRVVTLATGRPTYYAMAENLARSFLQWNAASGVRFVLCTDNPAPLPPDLAGAVDRVAMPPGRFGAGFSPKLHLDELVGAGAPVLFLDCDCLVTGPLAPIFSRFADREFVVLGERVSEGDFYGDIRCHLARAGLTWLPIFVGSFLYWRPGPAAQHVFAAARAFEARYDEFGLLRMRGATADEPVVALGLSAAGISPVADDGTLKADAHLYDYPPRIDVLRGTVRFTNRDPAQWRVIPNRLRSASPLVAHFNASYAFEPPYLREALILRLVRARGWPPALARLAAFWRHTLPHAATTRFKNLFRPLYRRVLGVRTIRATPRET